MDRHEEKLQTWRGIDANDVGPGKKPGRNARIQHMIPEKKASFLFEPGSIARTCAMLDVLGMTQEHPVDSVLAP